MNLPIARRGALHWLAALALTLGLAGCLPIPSFTTTPSTI